MKDYKITIAGIVETEEIHVMGFASLIAFDFIKENYRTDYKKLNNFLQEVKGDKTRISIIKGVNKDFKNIAIICGAIVELSGVAESILQENKGAWAILPPQPTVLKVILNGSYEYLKEAWQVAMEFIKNNKLIVDMYSGSWEVYKSEEASNLITEIYIPLIITKDKDLEKLSV